jgi:hypothetical protein
MIAIPPADLQETKRTASEILRQRRSEIVDDKLDDKHWFVAVVEEASLVNRRTRQWTARRAA